MRRIYECVVGCALACVLVAVLGVSPAFAEGPFWQVTQSVAPTHIAPGGEGEVLVTASNLGDAPANGATSAIVMEDSVPSGLTVTSVTGEGSFAGNGAPECTTTPVRCVMNAAVSPYFSITMVVHVKASGSPGTLTNRVSVGGGGASLVAKSFPVILDATPVGFGVESIAVQPFSEDGSLNTQAGSHPFELTTMVQFNQTLSSGQKVYPKPVGMMKDLTVALPPGLVGNPEVAPYCSEAQFTTEGTLLDECPEDSAIGVAQLRIGHIFGEEDVSIAVPVFNLVPSVGEPARFGFDALGVFVYLDTSLRTGGDYGVDVKTSNTTQITDFLESQVTFWGVPGDPRHDMSRGWCVLLGSCPTGQQHKPTSFLTLPTSCNGPFQASVAADSWAEPHRSAEKAYTLENNAGEQFGLSGCNRLPFGPCLQIVPDGTAASTPTGLTVGIHVPQEATVTPTGLAEADVKDTTVALPEGMALSPAASDGLQSCSDGQIGFEKTEVASGRELFSPASPAELVPGVSFCPEASKIGTVEIETPLLKDKLTGAAYLAAQEANPFGSLLAMYIVAEDPKAGVLVKLAGEVVPDEHTGQLVAVFRDTPDVPFENLRLSFFGGSRAPLATPALCGQYTTSASIAPWSGNAPATPSSTFSIDSGPNNTPCPNPPGSMDPKTLPFAPSLTGGTTSIQAGGLTPFTMTMSREDGQQSLDAIQLHMPLGVSGVLSGIELCGEAQANEGTCGANSLIGETTVSVGLGGDPFTVKGGRVYLTGPYEGAPFGLSIVNPAKAGPFDLESTAKHHPVCDCLVVRAKIEVDPHTAGLTVTSDTTGEHRIPTIIEGIPLQIKHVNVTIDRPGFTFNPTNCNPMSLTGAIQSSEGASSAVSVPFQVTNCAILGFKPRFSASTSGHTSRQKGASLDVKLSYPSGSFGKDANIRSVKVDLPKALPSRLTTLQKACPDAIFNANPASCPAASRVGFATASTPILANPLSGPAYFVSHGGAKFPELVVVLSGDGVSVQLDGETFISNTGVTSSTFRQVPDVPVSTFELTLPEGANSALAANGNLCATKLSMPTAFTAQNGLVVHQSTPIAVTGCSKHRVKRHKTKKANKHKKT